MTSAASGRNCSNFVTFRISELGEGAEREHELRADPARGGFDFTSGCAFVMELLE
jgi:hypothetical protein